MTESTLHVSGRAAADRSTNGDDGQRPPIPLRPAMWACTIVAAVLGCSFLGRQSLWLDEAYTASITGRGLLDMVSAVARDTPNSSLYYLVVHLWTMLGDSEVMLRLPSVAAAAAMVPVTMAVARRLFGPRAAVLTGVVAALNPFLLIWAQDARAYSLTMLLAAASMLCFLRALDRPTTARWVAYTVVTALAAYSHFFAALVVLPQLLSLALLDRARVPVRQVAGSMVALAVLWLPIAFAAVWGPDTLTFIDGTGVRPPFHMVASFAGSKPLAALDGLLLVVALAGAASAWRRWRRSPEAWGVALVVAWLAVPVLLVTVISFAKPLYLSRYLALSFPAFPLLVGVGLARLRATWLGAAILALAVLFAVDTSSYYRRTVKLESPEDWRAVMSDLAARSESDDAIAYTEYARDPAEYYLARHPDAQDDLVDVALDDRSPERLFPEEVSTAELIRRLDDHDRVWVIMRTEDEASLVHRPIRDVEPTVLAHDYDVAFQRIYDDIRLTLYQRPR